MSKKMPKVLLLTLTLAVIVVGIIYVYIEVAFNKYILPIYDEVVAMKNYLLALGIPQDDVFMDHAGFNTYDSIYRAKEIFIVKNAVLITQEVHLKRALYIADRLHLNAVGTIAPSYKQDVMGQRIREITARFKAFIQAGITKPKPKFLGETIPVFSNSGTVTDDKL